MVPSSWENEGGIDTLLSLLQFRLGGTSKLPRGIREAPASVSSSRSARDQSWSCAQSMDKENEEGLEQESGDEGAVVLARDPLRFLGSHRGGQSGRGNWSGGIPLTSDRFGRPSRA
eukprot:CAMPEP_0206433452 /NCGR_PEP_ID=MMETSP0324_2-20121206/8538_1 /ASSEMBLY_ACC=CAM_ASM_000836 /TAXON_ID=2866 /ORGANISM="Crypthecodinium cohnii, Strain Seligo" /LENGTH=115 /DNA_ID=CAMNT_0053899713 /DNA_START=402 /DNA_END=749 /DNA_ORIENTATION=-